MPAWLPSALLERRPDIRQAEQTPGGGTRLVDWSHHDRSPLHGGADQQERQGRRYCPGAAVCGTTRSQPERHSRTYG
ncbi:MAG: hypothetical protein DMD75_25845 [Candidatus Rokuibacteriota bacterium]|nr:MAG: hypothetical protein DMD75_25845 [Candidatus Rokubacteria bacterium]